MTSSAALVDKLWNDAHVLRDDGVGYGDGVEPITSIIENLEAALGQLRQVATALERTA